MENPNRQKLLHLKRETEIIGSQARVAELADALDLGSSEQSPEVVQLHSLASISDNGLTTSLNKSLKSDPDFTRLATAWPNLPDDIKSVILRLIGVG